MTLCHMLMDYKQVVGIDVIYHQCLTIKIMSLILIKLTTLDSVTINRNPSSDNEVSNKIYVDDSINEGTIVRFNQTLTNYLKVSDGNDTYNLTKYI